MIDNAFKEENSQANLVTHRNTCSIFIIKVQEDSEDLTPTEEEPA